MCCPDRRDPIRPILLRTLVRIDPFCQFRRPRQRTLRRLVGGFLGHALGQMINGLKLGQVPGFVWRHHMVGMHHLRHAIEHLQLTGHHTPRPLRQDLVQIFAPRVKEHQLEICLAVFDMDTVGAAAIAGRTVRTNRDLNGQR